MFAAQTQHQDVTPSTLVSCCLCGVSRRRLGAHLKATHGLSVQEYQTQFQDAPVDAPGTRARSSVCRERQAEAARNRWSSEEARTEQSEKMKVSAPWKGKKLTEEHCEAISQGLTGVKHNITDEYRVRLGVRGSKLLASVRAQPGYSEKLSVAAKLRKERELQEGVLSGFLRPEVRAKSLASRIKNGTLVPPGAGRGITGFREGLPHYCRSTLEANFARILVLLGVPYSYEPKVFQLPDGARWVPDFNLQQPLGSLIPAGWVELKGWRQKNGTYAFGASEKMDAFQRMTGEPVFVVCQKDDLWKQLEGQYSTLVPWETPWYNLRTHPQVFGRRVS